MIDRSKKYRIVDVHPDDGFYGTRNEYIGVVGKFLTSILRSDGSFAGSFLYESKKGKMEQRYFFGIFVVEADEIKIDLPSEFFEIE